MKYCSNLRWASFSALVCSLILLSACATTVSQQSRVEERVVARWDALLSGDLAGAYEYLSPGYRSSVSSLQYQRSVLLKKIRWTSAEYLEHSCEETSCKAKVTLGWTVHGAVPGVKSFSSTQDVEESWVLIDGIWYLVPEQ